MWRRCGGGDTRLIDSSMHEVGEWETRKAEEGERGGREEGQERGREGGTGESCPTLPCPESRSRRDGATASTTAPVVTADVRVVAACACVSHPLTLAVRRRDDATRLSWFTPMHSAREEKEEEALVAEWGREEVRAWSDRVKHHPTVSSPTAEQCGSDGSDHRTDWLDTGVDAGVVEVMVDSDGHSWWWAGGRGALPCSALLCSALL